MKRLVAITAIGLFAMLYAVVGLIMGFLVGFLLLMGLRTLLPVDFMSGNFVLGGAVAISIASALASARGYLKARHRSGN